MQDVKKEDVKFNWNEENMVTVITDGAKKEKITTSAKTIISQPQMHLNDMSLTFAISKICQELIAYEELRARKGETNIKTSQLSSEVVEGSSEVKEQDSPKLSIEEKLEALQKRVNLIKEYKNIIKQLEIAKNNNGCYSINIPANETSEDIKNLIRLAMMKRVSELSDD